MVSKHDDEVDFDKLETELNDALEQEQRYWKENDAKFRAVDQRVATYEEFRDIVLASHLKPLERNDKMPTTGFHQPWNTVASGSTATGITKQPADISLGVAKLPKNGHEFALRWRRFNNADKYRYLLDIGAQHLGDVFKSEISFGLLGDILLVLQQRMTLEDTSQIIDILASLSHAGRFGLSVKFLSAAEMETGAKLFSQIHEALQSLLPESGRNEALEAFNSLKKVYEI